MFSYLYIVKQKNFGAILKFFIFRNKKNFSKEQLLFSFLYIVKQKKISVQFLKFFIFENLLHKKRLKGGISIYADFGSPRYVLWCYGGICHQVLTFFKIGCGHTVWPEKIWEDQERYLRICLHFAFAKHFYFKRVQIFYQHVLCFYIFYTLYFILGNALAIRNKKKLK